MKKKTERFLLSLISAVLAVLMLASCGILKTPDDTTAPIPESTRQDDTTTAGPREEVTLVASLCSVGTLEAGSSKGPFSPTDKTVYITISVPSRMEVRFRSFGLDSGSTGGLSSIDVGDIYDFTEPEDSLGDDESTLEAFGLNTGSGSMVMSISEYNTSAWNTRLFGVFSKDGNEGFYRTYALVLMSGGTRVVPLVFTYGGYEDFRSADTLALVKEIISSLTVHSDGYAIELTDGLDNTSYSIYDNLPEGYSFTRISEYPGGLLALFATDADKTLYVGFFDPESSGMAGGWTKIADRSTGCEIGEYLDGLMVSPSYGKYYTVTGEPERVKVASYSKAYVSSKYSPNGDYRAYINSSNSAVMIEDLSTGAVKTAFLPSVSGAAKPDKCSAEMVTFIRDGSLIFRIDCDGNVAGFGIYRPSTGKTEEYYNNLTPIGCSSNRIWFYNIIDGKKYDFSCSSFTDPANAEVLITNTGDGKEGFFEDYRDTFLNGRLILNSDGSYFVFIPEEDSSRVSVYSTRTYECIYTSAVPNLSDVVALKDTIVLGTGGWAIAYVLHLPSNTTPGGSFDPDKLGETVEYVPDYYGLLDQLDVSVPYIRQTSSGSMSFANYDLIYCLLDYAARNGLCEDVVFERPVPAGTETGTSASPVTSAQTTDPSETGTGGGDKKDDGKIIYKKIGIYRVKELAWKLFGITEDYFDDYIITPDEDNESGGDDETGVPVTAAPVTEAQENPDADPGPDEENYYLGLTGRDYYDYESGVFVFLPLENRIPGVSYSRGGSVITSRNDELTIKTVLTVKGEYEGDSDILYNAEYTFRPLTDKSGAKYFRMLSSAVTAGADVSGTLPSFKIDDETVAPLWFCVEKNSNRVYYPEYDIGSASGIETVTFDGKDRYYESDELLTGAVAVCGTKALVALYRQGIYETAVVDIKSGSATLLGGRKSFADYSSVVEAMKKAGKTYPYYGARMLTACQNGVRVLYLTSDATNSLKCTYRIYDISQGRSYALSSGMSAKNATEKLHEYYQWMSSGRLRLAVLEGTGKDPALKCYEWVYSQAKWNSSATEYTTDGKEWKGSAGIPVTTEPEITTVTDHTPETTVKPDDPDIPITDDILAAFTDATGTESDGGPTLRQIAESYLKAKQKKIDETPGYVFYGVSEYVVTLRYPTVIQLIEYAEVYNANGEYTGRIAKCENLYTKDQNGSWSWTQLKLPK